MRDYSILDDLEEGVQIVSPNLCYVYLNKKLLKEIQMTSQDVIGFSMIEKFPGIDQTDVYREIIDCLQEGGSRKILNEFKFPDGRQSFYELQLQPIQEGVIIFTRDITTTKKGELLLKETNKQLEHFAHIAAHDMREPVRRIGILSEELLLDYASLLPQKAQSICEKLQTQSQSLMQLISDFRNLSGLGGKDLEKENVGMVQLAQKVSEPYVSRFKEKNIILKWPQEEVYVSAYSSLVAILLRNLFENALKHGCDEVKFLIEKPASELDRVFCVINKTSHSTPKEDIFLPFVKGEKTGGTGLGLAIAKKIIDRHSGKIWSEQQGEVFKICFTLVPNTSAHR